MNERSTNHIEPATSENRLNRTAWLALLASIAIIAASLAVTLYQFSLPTDGWILNQTLETDSSITTFDHNFLMNFQPEVLNDSSGLQPGDVLLAVDGIPLDNEVCSCVQLPQNWKEATHLTYTIRRASQTFEVNVPLLKRPLSSLWMPALADIPGFLSLWLTVAILIFIFIRRPRDPATQALLFLSAVYIAMWLAGLVPMDIASIVKLSWATNLWLYFNTWVWAGFLLPTLFLFTLVFPRPKRFVQRYPLVVLGVLYSLLYFLRLIFGDHWQIGWGLVAVFGVSALFSLVHSVITLRRDPVAIAQAKWVLAAMILTVGYQPIMNIFIVLFPTEFLIITSQPVLTTLDGIIHMLLPLCLPVAVSIAILRYRLWDIDVIIRKTLAYGSLTFTLGLAYFGSVLLLQNVFHALTGQRESPIVTVISTLLIAALFTPLRTRIQASIDRRFYRRKYDAEKTLASFAASLRDEVDLEQLTGHLISVVQESVQPDGISYWLKPAANRSSTAFGGQKIGKGMQK